MSKVFKTIGAVASIAAPFLPPPYNMIAKGIAVAAGIGAKLTEKKPGALGQVSGVLIGANNPLPYPIGESYTEGVEIYRVGYGGKVGKVQNPYAFIPRVLSCCGPIAAMGATLVDYEPVTLTGSVGSVQAVASGGYYEDFLFVDQRLGARPESTALATPGGWGTPTGWGAGYKLSGMAAVGWSLKWDKDGQVFGGGAIPPLGKVVQGVWAYDPRLDSTQTGGSGSHRVATESTWAYTANPALHAATYAYGRLMNGVPIFGCRLFDAAAIDWAQVMAWANVCDANGWTANGTIHEPDDKWNNLKRIAEAGAGVPVLRGGMLGFDFQAPRTSLYTITKDDLAAGTVSAKLGKGWKERHNTLVPRYRSPDHQWTYQQAEAIEVSAFLSADGEEKSDERQWDLVTDVDQVTELAIYDLYQRREAGPFSLFAKPHMRIFQPGDCLTLAAELGAHPAGAVKCVLRSTMTDPATGVVSMVLEQETDAKHAAALGTAGTAPGTPTVASTADIDEAWVINTKSPLDMEGSYTTGTTLITPYGTDVLVASESGETDGVSEVFVQVFGIVDVLDNCDYIYHLECGGVQVGQSVGPISVNTGNQAPLGFGWRHTPTPGAHTWELYVQCNNNGIQIIDAVIQITKKS